MALWIETITCQSVETKGSLHVCVHTYTCTYMYTWVHAYIHACICTRIYRCIIRSAMIKGSRCMHATHARMCPSIADPSWHILRPIYSCMHVFLVQRAYMYTRACIYISIVNELIHRSLYLHAYVHRLIHRSRLLINSECMSERACVHAYICAPVFWAHLTSPSSQQRKTHLATSV